MFTGRLSREVTILEQGRRGLAYDLPLKRPPTARPPIFALPATIELTKKTASRSPSSEQRSRPATSDLKNMPFRCTEMIRSNSSSV
jgi:hypothetical protein